MSDAPPEEFVITPEDHAIVRQRADDWESTAKGYSDQISAMSATNTELSNQVAALEAKFAASEAHANSVDERRLAAEQQNAVLIAQQETMQEQIDALNKQILKLVEQNTTLQEELPLLP